MQAMVFQSGLATASLCSSFPPQKPSFMHFKNNTPSFITPRMFHNHIQTISPTGNRKITALAAPETLSPESSADASETPQPSEEVKKVVVKQVERPRLVLKFVWMEKNIGLALDQQVPGHGTIPLSPYFFWPRKDAWEELKATLESKPWISQKTMIILLNQATDIINLWQQSGGNLTSQ